MSNTQLYRKVYCKDRLPGKEGEYDTEMGNLVFKPGYNNKWIYQSPNKLGGCEVPSPEYWLEPVQEPTEEEINKMAEEDYAIIGSISKHENTAFIDGFKKCLELLKGKK